MTEPSSRSARPPRGGRGAGRLSVVRAWLLRLLALLLAWQGLSLVLPGVLAVNLANGVEARDFVQEYLLARAVLAGINPYLPQPDLAGQVFPEAAATVLPHPVPHPPFVALLVTPLGALPQAAASVVWLALELVCLVASFVLLRRNLGEPAVGIAVLLGASLLWPPVMLELLYGQLNLLVLVLLVACWAALRADRQPLAGGLLALAAAAKVYPLLMVAYFLLRRKGRAAAWFCLASAALGLVTLVCLGPEALRAYVRDALPSTREYVLGPGNWTIIAATLRTTLGSASLPPLLPLGAGAYVVAGLAVAATAAWGAGHIRRGRDEDLAYALALCLTLLIQPHALYYYLVMLVLPLWTLWQRGARKPALAGLLLLSVTPGVLSVVGLRLASAAGWAGDSLPLPPLAGLPHLVLTAGPLLIAFALARALARAG